MSKIFFKVTLSVVLLIAVLAINMPALALSLNLQSSPSAVAMENGTTAS